MPEIFGKLDAWQAVLAVVVIILGSARITRLVVHDSFPPSIMLRIWWDSKTEKSLWNPLLHCHWCFSVWATALGGGTFFLTFAAEWVAWAWWLIYGLLALSYPVAQYVQFDDGGGSER